MDGQIPKTPFDLIVIGSGIAGLYAALLAAPHARVLLISKGVLEESNTRYAQGGIAVALAEGDSPALHRQDTMAAGDGLCDGDSVAILTQEAPACILDLLQRGVPFDREHGALSWTLEAAHSRARVLHAGGDATGARIEVTLVEAVRRAGVTIYEETMATELVLDRGIVRGVDVQHVDGAAQRIDAPAVLLATGGAGQLFARTTNPAVATGDGLALAFRAGAQLMDLEFVQFHPTALAIEGAPPFLISEAVRGEGGILRDLHGTAFMEGYHPDRELAPRDIVARAIHQQMMRTEGQVRLDVTHLGSDRLERRFPTILAFCRAWGIDPVHQPIPISPAAHYLMGGVRSDSWGHTSVPGLYACGEVACTGVHGANRLASNSLLEGLVFARRAVMSFLDGLTEPGVEFERTGARSVEIPDVVPVGVAAKSGIAEAMWRGASLVRSSESLGRTRAEIMTLEAGPMAPSTRAEHEVRNMHLVAQLMLNAADTRRESRGAHFRSDCAQHDAAWLGHIVQSRDAAGFLPLPSDTCVGALTRD